MLDPRGQLRRAALGFATCSMLSYGRTVRALRHAAAVHYRIVITRASRP